MSTSSVAALPPEVISLIIELAFLTSPPSSDAEFDAKSASPFASPLAASRVSHWSQLTNLLYVSHLFYALTRPLLLRTLTLNTPRSGRAFFRNVLARKDASDLDHIRRAWFGNITALRRNAVDIDPLCLMLDEAGWFEECFGGFIVGHTYASRPRAPRQRKSGEASTSAVEKQFQQVSVYWAEEQLVEQIRDDDEDDTDSEDEQGGIAPNGSDTAREDEGTERPQEPVWQTLYRRTGTQNDRRRDRRRTGPQVRIASGWVGADGPPAYDPWEMWEAQERHAALPIPSTLPAPLDPPDSLTDPADELNRILDSHLHQQERRLRRTEIYAYHLCTATLEPWINTLFASLRSLRFITLTFTPGHILDDDKLEHMLRRILSRSENPKLQQLLIRMVFEPSVAGSRMRRFERAKTIGGAVDRIADERVRVMLVAGDVGQGILVATPAEMSEPGSVVDDFLTPLSRRAVAITQEGWWSRVLQQNRFYAPVPTSNTDGQATVAHTKQESDSNAWTSFFGYEQGRAEWMSKTILHCNPFPDDPIPVEHPHYPTPNIHRQLNYVNGWAARDRDNTNASIEE